MRVSIEWFLLDNWLMNGAVLCCAAALSGCRFRRLIAPAACLLGAVYALLAFGVWPWLLDSPWSAPLRVLFGGVLALGLRFTGWKGYLRAALCVLLCAFLLGGLMLALSLLGEGLSIAGMQSGVLIGTVRLRVALVVIALATQLPRGLRLLRAAARVEEGRVPLRIWLDGKLHEASALLDTGNLLTEPLTGLPVVLLQDCPDFAGGYPVRYAGAGGEGELACRRAQRMQVKIGSAWRETDAMVARAPGRIEGAGALIGSAALPVGENPCEKRSFSLGSKAKEEEITRA